MRTCETIPHSNRTWLSHLPMIRALDLDRRFDQEDFCSLDSGMVNINILKNVYQTVHEYFQPSLITSKLEKPSPS